MPSKKETLFGTDLNGIKNIIVTPMTFFYAELKNEKEYKGWWNTSMMNDKTAVIKTPMASPFSDSVFYLQDDLDLILFLGFCGSYNPNHKTGEIAASKSARYNGNTAYPTFSKDLLFTGLNLLQVGSFNEQEDPAFARMMEEEGLDAVDMECHHFLSHAKNRSKESMAFYVISDMPGVKSFNELEKSDYITINKSVKDLSSYVRSLVE